MLQLIEKYATELPAILPAARDVAFGERYVHWDKLRHLEPPQPLNHEQWWLGIKMERMSQSRRLPLLDPGGRPFVYTLPDPVLAMLHRIDNRTSGRVELPGAVATEENRDRFVFNSLVEEAITSSQLEGASTTRQAAADMIRQHRAPRDKDERMIFNNFRAMESLRELRGTPLDMRSLMRLHLTLTDSTLEDFGAAGRLQNAGEKRVEVVDNLSRRVLHIPPAAELLPQRMEALIRFANETGDAEPFVHPVIRAIVLHFWLAYEHPFADGNGRTARALFYWSMLRQGYWLFEFISISRILKQAPARYGRAFLETKTDDNDLTYFILFHLQVILHALEELETYLQRKTEQVQSVESLLKRSDLNHRQIALLSHAIRHPGHEYTIKAHQTSHRVAYASARSDLLVLAERGFLLQRRIGQKTLAFIAPDDLQQRIGMEQQPLRSR